MNNIALQYAQLGDLGIAIKLLYNIKSFYDRQVCDIEEALRTKPMVLYNLAVLLGQDKMYDDSICICEKAIRLAIETGKCFCLPQTYYTYSCSLYNRNRQGDKVYSLEFMKLAYCSAKSMMRKEASEKYAKVLLDRYNFSVELL